MNKVLIIGAGLSGLTAAYLIKSSTNADVTIIEKGDLYRNRLLSSTPDMLSGVGGAGTVGGGKLCFPPASAEIWKKTDFSAESFSKFVSTCLVPFYGGMKPVQSYLNDTIRFTNVRDGVYRKRYMSSLIDKKDLNVFVSNMVAKVLDSGITLLANCKFKSLNFDGNTFLADYSHSGEEISGKFDVVLFSSGRSSAGKIRSWLPESVQVVNKNPDLGLRFSMKLSDDSIFGEIGTDVKIKSVIGDVGVRTFCVCSGGETALVSTDSLTYYDGHFGEHMTDIVNLGLLARSKKLVGYEYAELYCRALNRYLESDMTLSDFLKYWNKLIPETTIFDEIFNALAGFVRKLQKNGAIPGNLDSFPVFLPSVDNLNPTIKTNRYFETDCKNLYVIGDACGISRGFVQSMWSAYCACADIICKLNCPGAGMWGICAV